MKKVLVVLVIAIGLCHVFKDELFYFIYKKPSHRLINYDHGIVSMEDLRKADEGSFPASPFDGKQPGYPYWQCFNKKYLKMECTYNEPLDRVGSSLSIDIETATETHNYGLNHAISGEICDQLIADIHRVLSGQDYFCINGSQGTLDKVAKKREYSWSFYRIKTKNGYANYLLE
jgi:hypothetical protein